MTDATDSGNECSIKVVCRVRPLNESEEKTGSKFVIKFPTDDSILIGVSCYLCPACYKLNYVNSFVIMYYDTPVSRIYYDNHNAHRIIPAILQADVRLPTRSA